jgi:hypothetical protein
MNESDDVKEEKTETVLSRGLFSACMDHQSSYSSDSEDDGSVCSGSMGEDGLDYGDCELQEDGTLAPGIGHFSFRNPNTFKDIQVFYIKGSTYKKEEPPVVVFHGVFRNPDVYRDSWVKIAEEFGLFVVAPLFSQEHFPGTAGYNLGNICQSENDLTPKAERNWSYHVPEVVFEFLAAEGTKDTVARGYLAFGHSAGSQFLHRKVALAPDPRLLLAVSSNAGWYTMPTTSSTWPYGWGGLEEAAGLVEDEALAAFLSGPLVVQLGSKDIDKKHVNLRRTPEALAQGANRLERGRHFIRQSRRLSHERNLPMNWLTQLVPGVGHESALMAPHAARLMKEFMKCGCPSELSLVGSDSATLCEEYKIGSPT